MSYPYRTRLRGDGMARISLSNSQRQELEHLVRQGRDARMVRRAQGLLWLDQGEHPIAVAQRLGVTAAY
jgi:hypothetical protein